MMRWLKGTSNRTFILYPAAIALLEWLRLADGEKFPFQPWGLILLAWGYAQYRGIGRYRLREGGGGPGLSNPPERLVISGAYRYTRNPMYLGHLIFLLGLAVTFRSWFGLALFAALLFWFDRRARADERGLEKQFGADYARYRQAVKRWIPGLW